MRQMSWFATLGGQAAGFAALVFFYVASAYAGSGWLSSGGGIFRDAHNPWFVRNTTKVTYCLRVSATSVSMPEADVRKAVVEGFAYWTKEYGKTFAQRAPGQFELGPKQFDEVDCATGNPDIRFLIGYEALATDEINYLVKPEKYVGVTVRTEYDEANLRGKGFVYISSDFGPNAYDNPGSLITKAWSYPRLFKLALLHELGHVFGLPHTGASLMSEVFLEQILNKNFAPQVEKLDLPSFFSPDDFIETCDVVSLPIKTRTFFGMPATDTCLSLKRISLSEIQVQSRKNNTNVNFMSLGKILSAGTGNLGEQQSRPAVVLQLTNAQKVFAEAETLFRPFMFGPTFVEDSFKGSFLAPPATVKSVFVRMTSTGISITGTLNGQIDTVLTLNSPMALIFLISPVF